MEFVRDVIAGSVGGAAGIIVGNPFDVIKTRLQAENTSSFIRCAQDLLKEDGPKGFLRGLWPPLVGQTLYTSISFSSYAQSYALMESVFGSTEITRNGETDLWYSYWAGCVAGVMSTTVTNPFEVVKVKLQVDHGSRTGIKAMVIQSKEIWASSGLRGFYTGWWSTTLRDTPTTGIYFGLYHMIKEHLHEKSKQHLPGQEWSFVMAELVAGGTAGVVSWAAAIPCDVVKTKLQADAGSAIPKYKGVVDCAQQIAKQEGARGFVRGATPILLRAFPVNAVTFLVYERVLDGLSPEPAVHDW